MPGASNDGREDSPGSVITGESGLAHSGAIVHDKSGNILVTHDELFSFAKLTFANKGGNCSLRQTEKICMTPTVG